jgi:hypothetical protein
MMEVPGPRGLVEQGLLGAPQTARKNKPNSTTCTIHIHHTIHTGCTQPNIHRVQEGRNQNNANIPAPKKEIEAFRALEIGAAKWCKEHIPRKGNDLTDEGISLLDDM